MIISLGFELPRTSSGLPEDYDRASRSTRDLVDIPQTPRALFLFGLAPDDAYRAGDVATTAVGSYPTLSPLPDPEDVRHPDHRRFAFCGAGVGLLRLGITQRPALGVRTFLPMLGHRAIIRPSHPRRSSIEEDRPHGKALIAPGPPFLFMERFFSSLQIKST